MRRPFVCVQVGQARANAATCQLPCMVWQRLWIAAGAPCRIQTRRSKSLQRRHAMLGLPQQVRHGTEAPSVHPQLGASTCRVQQGRGAPALQVLASPVTMPHACMAAALLALDLHLVSMRQRSLAVAAEAQMYTALCESFWTPLRRRGGGGPLFRLHMGSTLEPLTARRRAQNLSGVVPTTNHGRVEQRASTAARLLRAAGQRKGRGVTLRHRCMAVMEAWPQCSTRSCSRC